MKWYQTERLGYPNEWMVSHNESKDGEVIRTLIAICPSEAWSSKIRYALEKLEESENVQHS